MPSEGKETVGMITSYPGRLRWLEYVITSRHEDGRRRELDNTQTEENMLGGGGGDDRHNIFFIVMQKKSRRREVEIAYTSYAVAAFSFESRT